MKIKLFYLYLFLFLSLIILIIYNIFRAIKKAKKKKKALENKYYNSTHCSSDLYDICRNCMVIGENSHPHCKDCPSSIILKGYKIKSPDETLDELINENKSIVRFGDGEFEIIFGYDIPFHNATEKLTKKLYEILQSDEKDLLIGIYNGLNSEYLKKYGKFAKKYWRKYNEKNKFKLYRLLNKSKQYYSTQITRFYFDYKKKRGRKKYVEKLKKL